MAFSELMGRELLRDIAVCFEAVRAKLPSHQLVANERTGEPRIRHCMESSMAGMSFAMGLGTNKLMVAAQEGLYSTVRAFPSIPQKTWNGWGTVSVSISTTQAPVFGVKALVLTRRNGL